MAIRAAREACRLVRGSAVTRRLIPVEEGAKSYLNLKAQGFEAVYNNSEIEMEVGNYRTEKGEIKYI